MTVATTYPVVMSGQLLPNWLTTVNTPNPTLEGFATVGPGTLSTTLTGFVVSSAAPGQTLTLPSPATVTNLSYVMRNSQTGTMYVGSGAALIFSQSFWGASLYSLTNQGQHIRFMSDGTNWNEV